MFCYSSKVEWEDGVRARVLLQLQVEWEVGVRARVLLQLQDRVGGWS